MSSSSINFNQIAGNSIPSGLRKPGSYFEFNTSNAINTLPGNTINVLMIGQMTGAGTQAPNSLIQVFSPAQAAQLFGVGSILHLMVIAALNANAYLNLFCIGLADAAGSVASTFDLTITGAATGTGVLTLNVGSQIMNVTVNVGDDAATIAGNLATAMAGAVNMPVTASAAAGVVTLTAKNAGTLGNALVISATALSGQAPIAGVTVAVASGTSGATDPVLNTALTTAFTSGVNLCVSAWNDQVNLLALKTWLDNVSNGVEQRGCVGVAALNSSLATATTLASALNEGRLLECLLPGAVNQSYEIAAAMAAVMATNNQNPALPLNDLVLTGILPTSIENNLSRTQQEACLANGVTPLQNGPGSTVQIVRAISTYTVNAEGSPDISLLDITTIQALDYVRLSIKTQWDNQTPRQLIDAQTLIAGRSLILDVLYQLQTDQVVENVDSNKSQLILQQDIQSPTQVDASIPANIIPGLMVFAAVINLIL